MDTPSMSSPTSPAASEKVIENSEYCVICIPLGKICPEEFAMSSDWGNEEGDQTKDKDKDNNQNQSQINPSFSTVMVTLKPPKPFTTKYFDSLSSETCIVYTPKEKNRCDTIMDQQ